MRKLIVGSQIVQRTKRAAVAKACAKYNATAKRLTSNARINLVIVGQVELHEVKRTKTVCKTSNKKYTPSKECKMLKLHYWMEHQLYRILSGQWVPTHILERMIDYPMYQLKAWRRKFFKREQTTFSLKWRIGDCFRGVKDFVSQLQDAVLVIG